MNLTTVTRSFHHDHPFPASNKAMGSHILFCPGIYRLSPLELLLHDYNWVKSRGYLFIFKRLSCTANSKYKELYFNYFSAFTSGTTSNSGGIIMDFPLTVCVGAKGGFLCPQATNKSKQDKKNIFLIFYFLSSYIEIGLKLPQCKWRYRRY